MERNELIKVDIYDNEIGTIDKSSAHSTPILHRAFSVYLVNNDGEMLIQKRASHKYHSPNLWANSCCSHPRPGEDTISSAISRLVEECNIHIDSLEELFTFNYMTKYAKDLYEYEVDHVLLGTYNGDIMLNPDEASDYRWVDIDILAEELVNNPEDFSSWFLISAPRVFDILKHHQSAC